MDEKPPCLQLTPEECRAVASLEWDAWLTELECLMMEMASNDPSRSDLERFLRISGILPWRS